MLALLHTAKAHVDTFGRLAREIDPAIPVRHEVREGLLRDAIAAGRITEAVLTATAAAIEALARDGARLIVCTCSTIGGVAESIAVSTGAHVMRIDRPMAEQAVTSGRRIVVVAALQSTLQPTVALLRQIALDTGRSLDVVEVVCERAWPYFERGDLDAYTCEIARTIEITAHPADLVLLAQASMAPAAQLLRHLGIPVLSSPRLGLEVAISNYRALQGLV